MAEKLDRNAVLYFLSGMALGSVIALLLAPQSGDETRAYLSRKARDASDYAQRKAQDIQERAETLLDQGTETIREKKDQITAIVNSGRKAFRRAAV